MHPHDLTRLNTLALGSVAPELVRYHTPDQLPEITQLAARKQAFVLGGGSNVVLAPTLSCLVIKVESTGIRVVSESPEHRVLEVEAGESWHGFVTHCVQQGWGGLENLALIPGTVGAAPVQNIGAYGLELDQRVHSVVAWDLVQGHSVEFKPSDCDFSYRNSMFKQADPGRWLILKVRFTLPKKWTPALHYPDLRDHDQLAARKQTLTVRDVYDAVCEIRRRKLPDPAVLANAGSFFKNPVVDAGVFQKMKRDWPAMVAYEQTGGQYWKLAAGWLIEQAGWKGRQLGPVGMHDRQALVLVNHGGATALDVVSLARCVCSDVRQRFGVELEQEPVMVS